MHGAIWSLCILCLYAVSLQAQNFVESSHWKKLPSLPNVHGVAAPVAGVWNEGLLVAGGANFPEKKPWEGGTKVWHNTVYWLSNPQATWREVGKLPTNLAYSVSLTTPSGIVSIGGSNAEQHFATVMRLRYEAEELSIESLPSLPHPLANACGAVIDNTIYIAGGLESPTATTTLSTFYALNLADEKPQWQKLPSWPGPPRMLAVAGVMQGKFYLCSGVDLTASATQPPQRVYLRDCYCYTPGKGWLTIAELPQPTVAAPSPALVLNSQLCIFGGDAGTHVGFQSVAEHPGFSRDCYCYNAQQKQWQTIAQALPAPRVTVPLVMWKQKAILPSGEKQPGIRSPEVWSFPTESRK